jgi:hypothetical protein
MTLRTIIGDRELKNTFGHNHVVVTGRSTQLNIEHDI